LERFRFNAQQWLPWAIDALRIVRFRSQSASEWDSFMQYHLPLIQIVKFLTAARGINADEPPYVLWQDYLSLDSHMNLELWKRWSDWIPMDLTRVPNSKSSFYNLSRLFTMLNRESFEQLIGDDGSGTVLEMDSIIVRNLLASPDLVLFEQVGEWIGRWLPQTIPSRGWQFDYLEEDPSSHRFQAFSILYRSVILQSVPVRERIRLNFETTTDVEFWTEMDKSIDDSYVIDRILNFCLSLYSSIRSAHFEENPVTYANQCWALHRLLIQDDNLMHLLSNPGVTDERIVALRENMHGLIREFLRIHNPVLLDRVQWNGQISSD